MRVLVVGAGASGLPAFKSALEQGFDAVCLERSAHLGGLWRFKEQPGPGEGTVMKSTVINTSKEMTAYSDFPPPADAPNYMHNTQMFAYLRAYAEHFDLLKRIKFRHRVLSVQRAKNFAENGQWDVKYQVIDTGDLLSEVFDGVMCCTGHHSLPRWPEPFPGQQSFRGRLLHSHGYRSARDFEDKTVVVLGVGNSGSDIAVELSKTAKQVYLATRSGSWIMNRVWDFGEPSDLALLNRFTYIVKSLTPVWLQNKVMEDKVSRRFDHGRFGLKPAHRFLEAHVTVNDELPNRIISGTVIVKPNIARFHERAVEFEDDSLASDVDVVIFATGYSFNLDFLEEGRLVKVEENRVLLYKFMFPPALAPRNTLCLVGLVQPTGSIMPIAEMQSRLFCAQLAGRARLPPPERMLRSALRTNARNARAFLDRPRHTLQVFYVDYMDSLARLLGARPSLLRFLLTDPRLARRLLFSGLVPYQYRLQGPHAWPEARRNILQFDRRVFECTRTRRTAETAKAKPPHTLYVARLLL